MQSSLKPGLVLFSIPSTGQWHNKFGMSALGMTSHFLSQPLPGYRTGLMFQDVKGSILANKRLDAVKQLLEVKSISHLLFIDTDQSFPRNTLHRLMAWDKDVVGANIATKKIPSWPTARLWPEDRSEAGWGNAPVVYTTAESTGLQEVARLGAGLVLVKRQVFEKTGLDIFGQPWRELWKRYQGEDWSMCEAIEKVGFKMYVDHDLSKNVGHWGEFEYTHDYVQEVLPSEPPNGQAESKEPSVRRPIDVS